MDRERFDAIARSLPAALCRRGALALLVAGPLTLLTGGEPGSGKRKKKKRKKKRPATGTTPTPDPAPNPPPCQGKPDDTPCAGVGRCLNGVCNPPPACRTLTDSVELGCVADAQCCSGECFAPSINLCFDSGAGQACRFTEDCSPGLACIGYRCG